MVYHSCVVFVVLGERLGFAGVWQETKSVLTVNVDGHLYHHVHG